MIEDSSILLQAFKQDNEAAFIKIYEDYYTRLCFYAAKFIHDSEQARSIVQEVYVELWIKRKKLNISFSLKAYLFNSVRNACVDYLRKEKINNKALSRLTLDDTVSVDHMEAVELNARINKAIQELPEKCREIFILCRFDGLKYGEIARKLGISIKTVEMQMGIALKKLRNNLSDYQYFNLLAFILLKK